MPHPRAALSLAARAYARYAGPFVALAALALAPVWLVLARATRGPLDVGHARAELQVAWLAAGVLWAFQLAVVAAVAPAVRALAGGTRLSQWRALRAGVVNLVRAIVPLGLALACVMIAGVALVVPALVVFPLVALTGASEQLGAPPSAAVIDSIAIARRNIAVVAAIALGMVVLDLVVVGVLQRALLPLLPPHPAPADLARFGTFVRVTIGAFIVLAPLPAAALAAVTALDKRR